MANGGIQGATSLGTAVKRKAEIIDAVRYPSSPLALGQAPEEVNFQIAALWCPQRKCSRLSKTMSPPGSSQGHRENR